MLRTSSYIILVVIITVLSAVSLLAQQDEPEKQISRCYQFTWLGPRFNNESVFMNATCLDATRLSSGVPCKLPLVVSQNGTWPDVDYIWENHRQAATCIPADNDICATYTYYFNGLVENSTYMCTRALDSMGQAITRGCYEQRNGSFVTRASFCKSVPGALPCNHAPLVSALTFAAFVVAMLITLKGVFI
ncbi:hypothetical protein ACJJTC_006665 [Scirpophaga incertulas]